MGWDGLKKFVFHRRKEMPDGLWMKCDSCGNLVHKKVVEEKLRACPECNFHFSLTSSERIALLLDEGNLEEYWGDLESIDPLKFSDRISYKKKTADAQEKTGLKDAFVVGKGRLGGIEVIFGVMDSRFIMASMGSVVGEKVTRAAEKAAELKIPLIIVSASGGARMQEGCFSLMQMAKTSAAMARLHESGGLYISILTNPTTAGVMASFAALGDIMIAEPKALIGFTGPRVIAQTIGQELPPGFQTSEFLLERGMIDRIIDRQHLKEELIKILEYCNGEKK